ncbi:MAG: PhnB protein, partial [Pseudonocardiales bacterium]|nr:PhnB protein [Pseudonocardiales bacterium]
MGVTLNPYLNFKSNAREAMEFYKSTFGGELQVSTFGDIGGQVEEQEKDLVMHAQLQSSNGITLMGADTPSHMEFKEGSNGQVSLSGDDEDTLRGYWDKLADGGSVSVPLEKAPWGDTFGMCVDR